MTDPQGQNETDSERWNRNFTELLQELRVAQVGVQILFAFLLTLPFSTRFGQITILDRAVYVTTLVATATATALLIAPVSYHRRMFRQGRKPELVRRTSMLTQLGLVALLVAMIGSVFLVVEIVAGLGWSVGLAVALAALYVGLWYVMPALTRSM